MSVISHLALGVQSQLRLYSKTLPQKCKPKQDKKKQNKTKTNQRATPSKLELDIISDFLSLFMSRRRQFMLFCII
jgi:hypothetical protein